MENLIELGREIFRKYYKIPYNLLCHSCHDSIFLFLLLCSLPSIFIGFSSSPWLYHPCKSIRLPNSYLWLWLFSLTLGPSVQKLPWWLSGKESTCNAEDRGSIPGLERSLRWVSVAAAHRLSSCDSQAIECVASVCSRTQAQWLWRPALIAAEHVESSLTRIQTHVPCISRWILIHCAKAKSLIVLVYNFF